MENQPLNLVVAKLKGKLNYPPTITTNTAEDCRLASLIIQAQEWLADQWSWPTLDEWWDVTLMPNTRWYAVPTNADYGIQGLPWNKRRPLTVNIKYSSVWTPVDYGINEEDYNQFDSDIGQVCDPVLRWDYNGTSQIEAWPIPASSYTLRFRGQRTLVGLTTGQTYDPTQPLGNIFNGAGLLDLDDTMIIFVVAGFHFAEDGKPMAPDEMKAAIETVFNVRAQMPVREEYITMGGDERDGELVRLAGVKIIATAGGH